MTINDAKQINGKNIFIAKTFAGLEGVLAEELLDLGASKTKIINRGVQFEGNKELMYKANYSSRTALRILKPIATFKALNEDQLYNEILKIDWGEYLDVNRTFAIEGITSYSNITHSKYLALKTKDAIADRFREKTGKRPSVDTYNPDLRINVRIFKNESTVSLDSSGESLHKRGYRIATGLAPINEVLTAGMILLSGWDKKSNFIDPMCGSGTIPIEAALFALNIPPGFKRKRFGFEGWKDFDKDLWEKVKKEALEKRLEFNHQIIGSDRSGRIMKIAGENVNSAGLENIITLKTRFIDDLEPLKNGGIMIMNPPYGERMTTENITDLYKKIGDTLKKSFKGYSSWIISADMEALKFIGLRPSRKIKLFNGPLESRFCKFEIYEGSRKRN